MRIAPRWVVTLGLMSFAGCTASTPCGQNDAGECLQIAGTYLFVFGEQVSCGSWESHVPATSVMTITQSGSSISAQLWPDTDGTHFFSGTLFSNNSINISEPVQNQSLGIPFGTITGTFTNNAPSTGETTFLFNGQLFLQGGATSATTTAGSGGATTTGLGCSGSTSMTAQEQGEGFVFDGGDVLPDAGTDAG